MFLLSIKWGGDIRNTAEFKQRFSVWGSNGERGDLQSPGRDHIWPEGAADPQGSKGTPSGRGWLPQQHQQGRKEGRHEGEEIKLIELGLKKLDKKCR